MEYSENDIKAVSPREWLVKKVVEKAEIDLLYVIMGGVREYFGGYELHDEVVDVFFKDEYEKAVLLKNVCEAWLRANQLPNDLEFHKNEESGSWIVSKTVCAELKKHFTKPLPVFLNHACYVIPPTDELFSDLQEGFNFKQYSFLIGVTMMNRVNNEPKLVMVGGKVQMVIGFIKKFWGFGGDGLTVRYVFNATPGGTKIELGEGNLLFEITNSFIHQYSVAPEMK